MTEKQKSNDATINEMRTDFQINNDINQEYNEAFIEILLDIRKSLNRDKKLCCRVCYSEDVHIFKLPKGQIKCNNCDNAGIGIYK